MPVPCLPTPGVDYGFYFKAHSGDYLYLTQSSVSTSGVNFQHFAVFNGTEGVYYLGMEDTLRADNSGEGRIGDFNDLVVKLTALHPIPICIC